ncbi:MAG: hypothetical protein JO269_09540 [Burkholderiaceae bacterium]|nr:hypothetical protein [Burkholderiaceae bacterium]
MTVDIQEIRALCNFILAHCGETKFAREMLEIIGMIESRNTEIADLKAQLATAQEQEEILLSMQADLKVKLEAARNAEKLVTGYVSSTLVSDGPDDVVIHMHYESRIAGDAAHDWLCRTIDAAIREEEA